MALQGDNLALNCISGMEDNFNTEKYCRICESTNHECRVMCTENAQTLRNKNKSEEEIINGTHKASGVIEKCIFHEIPDYYITENLSCDLMHD